MCYRKSPNWYVLFCDVLPVRHHYFYSSLMILQVLKVPSTNPLAWQTALIDSEVDCILCKGADKMERGGGDSNPPREFLRRGSGRTCTASSKEVAGRGGAGVQVIDGDRVGGGARRLEIVSGEVCSVCQEEMEDRGKEGAEEETEGASAGAGKVQAAEVRGGEGGGRLTYCRDGCGNNMHTRWAVWGMSELTDGWARG